MATSVYVALSVDALSSHASAVNALCDGLKTCAGSSSTQETSTEKTAPTGALRKKLRRQN
jgi:hypothetical protein